MIFLETPVFTKLVKAELTDEVYGEFQQWLTANPDSGALIKESGGLQKVRWKLPGSNLSKAQVKQLAKYAKEWK